MDSLRVQQIASWPIHRLHFLAIWHFSDPFLLTQRILKLTAFRTCEGSSQWHCSVLHWAGSVVHMYLEKWSFCLKDTKQGETIKNTIKHCLKEIQQGTLWCIDIACPCWCRKCQGWGPLQSEFGNLGNLSQPSFLVSSSAHLVSATALCKFGRAVRSPSAWKSVKQRKQHSQSKCWCLCVSIRRNMLN